MMGEDGAADGRRIMFGVVEKWWRNVDQNELRRKLSREGVENLENHLEGVHDTGHGCGKPLGMAKNADGASSSPLGGAASGLMGALAGAAGQGGGASGVEKFAEEAVGGGALGGLVGALAGGVGGSLLSGAFGGGREDAQSRSFSSEGRTQEGGFQQSYTEVGRSGNQYAQAQYSETQLPGGGRETDYQRFQQQGEYGAGFEQRTEARPTYGGGYEQTTERVYQSAGDVETETWREGRTADGRHYHEARPEFRSERRGSGSSSDSDRKKHHHGNKHHGYGEREEQREDYMAPRTGYGETFEERRHEREFEAQPSYGRESARREFEEPALRGEGFGGNAFEQQRESFGNRFGEQRESFGNRFEEQRESYGSREHGNDAGWGQEPAREEYQEERREEEFREEVREEGYREERSEGGGWFN
jgi:hypothetical protein